MRAAPVGFQQSAQSLDTDDLAIVPSVPRFNDSVDALMNPLVMVVFKILGQDVT